MAYRRLTWIFWDHLKAGSHANLRDGEEKQLKAQSLARTIWRYTTTKNKEKENNKSGFEYFNGQPPWALALFSCPDDVFLRWRQSAIQFSHLKTYYLLNGPSGGSTRPARLCFSRFNCLKIGERGRNRRKLSSLVFSGRDDGIRFQFANKAIN